MGIETMGRETSKAKADKATTGKIKERVWVRPTQGASDPEGKKY